MCDDGDSTTTTSNVSCTVDTHRSYDRDCDKTVFTVSDVDPVPPLDSVQATLSPTSPHRIQPTTFLSFTTPTRDVLTRRSALFLFNAPIAPPVAVG